MIAIVDYGVGNLRSVERALVEVGAEAVISSDLDVLAEAEGVVLPGVGAFAAALHKLMESGMGDAVIDLAQSGKPVLGVCVGFQLLFEESLEHGRHRGLGLLPGRVVEVQNTERLPVIGWCQTHQLAPSPLWAGIPDRAYFYYVHSYTPAGSPAAIGAASHSPAAAAARANVMGTQFHPEKSGAAGLRMYANFLAYCRDRVGA